MEDCAACRTTAPFYEDAARRLEPLARFAKLNTDDETAPAERYRIRSIPTLIVFRDGEEIARQSGAMTGNTLVEWLSSAIR